MLINKYTSDAEVYSVLDNEGNIIQDDYEIPLTDDEILESYYWMKLSRILDQRMIKMQRQGRRYTFPPNLGEEALQIAVSLSMDKEDWFVPAFRSAVVLLHRGVPAWQIMLTWKGNELGNKIPVNLNVLPFNITIAAQYSHATGIGMALNYQKKDNVAFTFIGDGGTAEGEFYEAMNFASVRNCQTVFCINNNQWAISTPTEKETGQPCLASKAIAAGIDFIKVDGNDVFASYDAAIFAREYVLENKKPILVEFMTYRQGPHTTSDNPKLYRSEEYEKQEELKDPISRLEKWMINNKLLDAQKIMEIEEKIHNELDEAYKIMESKTNVSIDEIFDYTYQTIDESLVEQKELAKKTFGDM